MKKIGQITETALKAIPRNGQLKERSADLEARLDSVLSFYPTVESFAIDMNLENCFKKYSHIKTVEDGLVSRKIKVRELAAIYGEDKIASWISLWLISLSKYMDFQISNEQADITSIDILSEMYMLNIAELTLLFTRIRKGHYGIFYGKFNMQTIMLACKGFRVERGGILSKMKEEEQNKLK